MRDGDSGLAIAREGCCLITSHLSCLTTYPRMHTEPLPLPASIAPFLFATWRPETVPFDVSRTYLARISYATRGTLSLSAIFG